MMAVRAVTSCSLFRPSSPPLFSSALRFFPYRSRGPPSLSLRYGAHTQTRSVQSLFNSLMEELRAARKRRQKRVSAAASNRMGLLNEELAEDRLVNHSLQKGLLLEFKKDSDRVLLAVAQRPDGKKNWMVSDQNGFTSSIKPQQVTYIVPGIDNFDQADIADFAQKAQDNMDPSLLEFAWVELLEKNKSVTVEELAEIIFGSTEALESYSAHLLLSKDEVYFTVLETKGFRSVYGPRPSGQVEELIHQKLAKEAVEKEFQEFIELLASVKSMSSQDKPPKHSWTKDERIWSRIESLEAYAIDACKNDEQRKTAGMVLKEMGLAKTASSAVKLLIDIGYFPVHINLDLLKLGIPTDHSDEIISAAQSLLLDSSDPDEIDRKNLTDLKVYAIDVDEADELDDALSATKLQDGRIKVWIHVADPTRYVQPGSIVDREAMRRGTSVFLPTATYSMFPENLAMGGMSLRQGELCNAVTVSVVLHNDGSIAEYSVFNSVIKPTYMLTYESASELLHLNLQEEGELRILSEAANLRSNWRRQQVKAFLRGKPPPFTAGKLEGIAAVVNENVRTVRKLCSSSLRYWILEYLRRQPKERTYRALVLRFLKDRIAALLLLEVGFQASAWIPVGMQIGDEVEVKVEEAHPRDDILFLKEVVKE
ncbi:ribonuclease II, chloroplastic/mitochondrial isoform X5 [Glycine max]|uniref:RNB domain-containing protein n=1 Tax=Glycine max TaxID=3847 RepID=A0A0R0F0P2_SOYBN|nr:ribonuclease II, chloroplastic/mitochondrial isoform X5 [Glycine max]